MNLHPALLFAAAALAGWGGMTLWLGRADSRAATTVISPPPAASSQKPGTGSSVHDPGGTSLAGLCASLAALPPGALAAKHEEISHWPPGTARTLALTLLEVRTAPPEAAVPDPLTPPPEDVPPAGEEFRELAAAMAVGARVDGGADGDAFRRWVSLDPAAATTAILKMPAGENCSAAVDEAAGLVANADPVAAMKFVRESGEPRFGEGTIRAWLKLVNQTARLSGPYRTPETGAPFVRGLSPAQQESLLPLLTSLVNGFTGKDTPGSASMMSDDEFDSLILELPYLANSPANQHLVEEIAQRSPSTLLNLSSSKLDPARPEHAVIFANALERRLLEEGTEAIEAFKTLGTDSGVPHESTAVLDTAAPRLLAQMARAGHVTEAAQLLDRVRDPEARREAFENILPAWMDADPAAARAAFNAAPLTALERERWERDPAFLLHPAP